MRTEIQALRDMGTSWKVTESVHRGTVAWEKGRFRSFTNYYLAFPLFPTGKVTRKSRVAFKKKNPPDHKVDSLDAEEHLQDELRALTSTVLQVKGTWLSQSRALCLSS